MITTILFDLDGTLLPLDQDKFAYTYIKKLSSIPVLPGLEPASFEKAVMMGLGAMMKNDGSRTNEDAFWHTLSEICGEDIKSRTAVFDEFYENEFQRIKDLCGFTPAAAEAVAEVKKAGFRVVLATNPVFPAVATESRIRWAGLAPEDFDLVTTFENSSFAKPDPKYYSEICAGLGVSPEECLMVGNDVTDDMVAEQIGMKVFLLTDCLVNRKEKDISVYQRGGFDELISFIGRLAADGRE